VHSPEADHSLDAAGLRRAFLSLIVTLLLPFSVTSAADCESELADAERYYSSGQFDDALYRLETCLDQEGISPDESRLAHRLMGLTLIALYRLDQARGAVESLLEIDPDYELDPNRDPPQFVALVEDVRSQRVEASAPEVESSARRGWRKWLLAAGGAVVTGVVVGLIAAGDDGGNGGSTSLPDPPDLPPQP
jgi:tetratricopeptide (TPR) repeat protein